MSGMFHDKVVMITGASGNLGSAVVAAFAAEDAQLALVDRHAETVIDHLNALHVSAKRYHIESADLSDARQVDLLVEAFEKHFDHIDVLAHTVGGYAAGQPVHETGIDVWDKMINLNARPLFLTCGRVARHMVEKNVPGAIVAVLARAALKGAAKQGAYTANQGIRVNAILPGTIDTPQNREAIPDADFSRWVQPAQLADAIVYLASEKASAIIGTSVEVYGQS